MNNIATITNIIKSVSSQIDFNFNLIHRINITIYDKSKEYEGIVKILNINDTLAFEIFFQQNVLNDLLSDNEDKILFAKSIIQHEIFHCKEMSITSLHLDWKSLYFHKPISTTKLLLLDEAYHQWSEYYAYYNSAKTYKKDINLSDYISKSDAALTTLEKYLSTNSNIKDIQINYSFLSDITKFISECIMLIAHYNSTNCKKYETELNYYSKSSLYKNYYPYLKDLCHYMNTLYLTFPSWISEAAFIELGYKLFSFIRIHNLTYSTEDLSDNFVLKMIE